MRRYVAGSLGVLLACGLSSGLAFADGDADKVNLTFGGFIDTYYLYDFNAPSLSDRTLTNGALYATTGERSNEFNINLAFVEARISSDRVRGRLALQAGTSVQAAYYQESSGLGLLASRLPAELIQEAYVGYRIADGLWVDGGIYFAHIGFESFISRDNWAYTRSMIADFSPYYETGVKLTFQPSSLWLAQVHVLNGWQNIYETNKNKALGLQLSYTPPSRLVLTYNNYFGDEPGGLARFFNELIGRVSLTDSVQVALTLDEGSQVLGNGTGTAYWYGGALLAHWQLCPKVALTGRVEQYIDKHGVIVQPGTPDGFSVTGASANVDVQLHQNLLWRNEARVLLSNEDAVFTGSAGPETSDKFLVSSLALSF
jgi:hypothetical protein